MAQSVRAETNGLPPVARPAPRLPLTWLGVVPFFLFVAAFLFYPAFSIVLQTFLDPARNFTLQNLSDLNQPIIISSYIYTIELSAVTALIGGLLGFLLAYAITIGALPAWLRSSVLTFSGVASNFAGIPLAFAFIATLGQLGLVTQALRSLGIALYPNFSLYSFWGLAITYVYFQIPLMVLVMTPALDSLRTEWREAAQNLGASSAEYWRYVALPVLLPSILGTMALLFGNAFGAHATAFALTGGGAQGNVVTILIGAQLSSDALSNPGLGNALAFGMIVIMTITIGLYSFMRRIAERWQSS
ncbi:MAG: ABC transporter permease subunit [Chloroflexi bacterium SZAS-1]|jgi:putative spermidine/putrescine transport system permease protein|nr:ABC transporter permease subunit [Chloroflexi bacterium SZAS-1]